MKRFSIGMSAISAILLVGSLSTVLAMNALLMGKRAKRFQMEEYHFDPMTVKSTAMISAVVWGLVLLKGVLGYKATQSTDTTYV